MRYTDVLPIDRGRLARASLVLSIAAYLPGCWMPPSASVIPSGNPRTIEGGIAIERVADPATVEGVDRAARTLVLSAPGFPLATYKIGRGVLDWGDIRIGDRVRATIDEVLTVYVAPANESGSRYVRGRNRAPDARVLVVDPSYRLLTVQYPNGRAEAFKLGLHTRMEGIEAGDSVTIRPVQVIGLRVQRRPAREESSHPSQSPTSAR